MKYLCLVYEEAKVDVLPLPATDAAGTDLDELGELRQNGRYIDSARLQPAESATTVRVREGKRLVTDGPFAETREHLGGYFMVDAKDLNEAISIASRIPAARFGTVEVRPIIELPNLPKVAK